MSEVPNPSSTERLNKAVLKAADWIESHPDQYDYHENDVPKCGTPGCALGWIGHFLRIKPGKSVHEAVLPAMSLELLEEFSQDRMDELGGWDSPWREVPKECARVLRLYAKEYCQ